MNAADARPCPQHQGDEPVRPHLAPGREAEARRGRDRRHRQHQFRSVGRRPSSAEFLHAGQHGSRLADRARRRAGAAEAPHLCARGRRLAADATGLPVDDRDAGAEKPLHDRDGQWHLPDHRRATDPGRGGRGHRRHRAPDAALPTAPGRPTKRISSGWSINRCRHPGRR